MHLKSKTAFVTGGANGLGREIVETLLKEGAKAVIADVAVKAGEELAASLQKKYGKDNVVFIKCDVADEESFKGAFKSAAQKFGHIHVIVNNAGILDEKHWQRMVAVSFNGVVTGTYLAIDHMRVDKGGQGGIIINMASIVGLLTFFGLPVYSSIKHAVVAFTRSWAEGPEVSKMGIRFAALCPDAIPTAMVHFSPEQVHYYEITRKIFDGRPPMNASRVGEAVLKVIADDAGNGATLPVTVEELSYKTPILGDGIIKSPLAYENAVPQTK